MVNSASLLMATVGVMTSLRAVCCRCSERVPSTVTLLAASPAKSMLNLLSRWVGRVGGAGGGGGGGGGSFAGDGVGAVEVIVQPGFPAVAAAGQIRVAERAST